MEAEAAFVRLWVKHKLTTDKVQIEEIVLEFFFGSLSINFRYQFLVRLV
jgi:hypothetical protein